MSKYRHFWLLLVIAHVLIAIPNATISKAIVDTVDPLLWILTRSLFLVVFVTPFVWKYIPKLFDPKVARLAFFSAVCMALSVIISIYAIAYSQASYISTLAISTPVVLMLTSMFVFKERMHLRAAIGVAVAAIGAAVLVIAPLIFSGQSFAFYPLATVLMGVNIILFSIAIISLRVLNQRRGLPLTVIVWYGGVLTAAISGCMIIINGGVDITAIKSPLYWLAGFYAGVLLMYVGRILMIKVLEVVPPAVFGTVGYVETFGSIIFPVIVLGERISTTMIVGGLLILVGAYLIESHKRPAIFRNVFHHNH